MNTASQLNTEYLLYCSGSDYDASGIDYFINLGADLGTKDRFMKRDAFGWLATSFNHERALKIAHKLYDNGYRATETEDSLGLTPMEHAIYSGNQSLVKQLNLWSSNPKETVFEVKKDSGYQFFSLETLEAEASKHCPDQHVSSRLNSLKESGENRKLSIITDKVRKNIRALAPKFPNFSHIIEKIDNALALQELSDKKPPEIRMPLPILIHGGAGFGKTHFITEVAKAFNTEFSRIDCGNTSPKYAFSGTPPTYQNSDSSKVVTSIVRSENMNPVILLDEIDKLNGKEGQDAFGPLYSLLEPGTAGNFRDEFYNLEFDLSHVIWFATANDISLIPEPILSRMDQFEIKKPGKEQVRAIAQSIYSDLINKNIEHWGSRFEEKLEDNVLDSLSSQTPREIRRILTNAFSTSAARNSLVKDSKEKLSLCVKDIQSSYHKSEGKKKAGF